MVFSQDEKHQLMEKLLDRQLTWVSAAETRLSLTVPLGTALFGTVAAKVPGHKDWDFVSSTAVSCTFVLVAASILLSALAVVPRVKGAKKSIIFFGCIASAGLLKFREEVAALSVEAYLDDLTEQVFINASIAMEKYWYVKRSMLTLLASLIPWSVSVFVLYGGN